jgi:plastocyanin
VEKARGTFAPKTHRMDQKGMKFIPHLMTVTAGDTVEFLNSDIER